MCIRIRMHINMSQLHETCITSINIINSYTIHQFVPEFTQNLQRIEIKFPIQNNRKIGCSSTCLYYVLTF
jgi:hypothetical protein